MNVVPIDGAPREKQSFEAYFEQYYQQVFQYLMKKVSSAPAAEDLAMDSFAVCWEKFDAYDPARASFGTWLYVIVNNKLKNYYRDHKTFDEMDETFSVQEDFEDSLLAAEYLSAMRDALCDALEALPQLQREIVIHKYFRGRNSNEIALLVGLTPGNVRTQLSRALAKLKEYFRKRGIRWEN